MSALQDKSIQMSYMSELIQLSFVDSSGAKHPCVDTVHAGLTCLLREERDGAVFCSYLSV